MDRSEANFDHVYEAKWWPSDIPALVLAGADDRIVWQGGWNDPKYHGPNVLFRTIPSPGHFPWIENAQCVAGAFAELAARLAG